MSPKTPTPEQRLAEFPGTGLEIKNDKLWCVYCQKDIDFKKKSHVVAHVNSKAHVQGAGM